MDLVWVMVLGCQTPGVGPVFGPEDSPLPVFDTARIHAAEAARLASEVITKAAFCSRR